jgi:hypothetical protein
MHPRYTQPSTSATIGERPREAEVNSRSTPGLFAATIGSGHNRQHQDGGEAACAWTASPRVSWKIAGFSQHFCPTAGFSEDSLDVRKSLFSLVAAFALLSSFSLQARAQYEQPQVAPNSTLANVRYDWRWELYGGFAYSHFDAGPQTVQGANLGGFDIQAARFFTPRWAVAANGRGYYGTSGAEPNPYGIKGPFVSEHMFLAGPEYRGPSNQHISMLFHALVGGAYGNFSSALQDQQGNPVPASAVGFFNNGFTFASALGGSIDLNRSPRLVFRISPDATLTNFGGNNIKEQFALSVGIVYRLGEGFHPVKKPKHSK